MTQTQEVGTVNADEAMRLLGIGRSLFYQLAKADELPIPTIRIGRRMRFSRRALDELLAGRDERNSVRNGEAK